jgi:hypothetical protein
MTESAYVNKVGTKERFRGWLYSSKSLSLSKYNKLPTEVKLKIQKEYKSK